MLETKLRGPVPSLHDSFKLFKVLQKHFTKLFLVITGQVWKSLVGDFYQQCSAFNKTVSEDICNVKLSSNDCFI